MLKVVIVGYGEMFTNLIAAALDANCKIVGVLRNDVVKYPKWIRKIKDTFNPSIEYNYIKSYNKDKVVKLLKENESTIQNIIITTNKDEVIVEFDKEIKVSPYGVIKEGEI